MAEKIFSHIDEIDGCLTNHNSGFKKVFLSNEETLSKLTQFAFGKLEPQELCDWHVHETMEECFYFTSGQGVYDIGDERYELSSGVFVRIPAGVKHRLLNNSKDVLEFVYFGVALG